MVKARSQKPLRVCAGCLVVEGPLVEPEPEPEPEPLVEPEPAPQPQPQPEARQRPRPVAEGVPVLVVSRRTFSTSHFKPAYDGAEVPGIFELGAILTDLIRGYCAKEKIPWKEEGQPFLKKLQAEAMANAQELVDQIPVAAQRIWTSALTLRGREFCFILNAAVRDDADDLADPTAQLARAINQLCVTAGPSAGVAVHPPDFVCYRG